MEQPGADQIVESIVRRKVKAASYSRAPSAKFIERLKAPASYAYRRSARRSTRRRR
jgi:hypothetical protein